MVLILFAMMFLNLGKDTEPQKPVLLKFAAVIAAGLLLVTIFAALKKTDGGQITGIASNNIGLVKELGKTLFRDFLLPFEIISILLLSAMVGAVLLAKRDTK